ncbi:MAG: HAMP domain-containing sensor histidine kinase [Thermoguttaceae bacterium]|nr:HAMP domain-containing sensor histidine kinase [Thermoguttaceae bacterium]
MSRRYAILIAVLMFVVLVALTVGWVLVSVVGAVQNDENAPIYWTLLSVGSVLFVALVVGTALHLTLSVKAINLSRRQSNFIDAVTHELKSPIASLKLTLQTLARRKLPEAQQQIFFRQMLDVVERLDGLVNHILDAGRSETSRQTAENQAANLTHVLQNGITTVCIQYHLSENLFRWEFPEYSVKAANGECFPAYWAHIEANDALTLFRNLLDNAVKYAGTPPQVVIQLTSDEKYQIVRIADNGPGVPQGLRKPIFKRFIRGGNELEREKPGTGLGLSIVRALVHQWSGRVHVVESRMDCPGACFEVRLRKVDHGTLE